MFMLIASSPSETRILPATLQRGMEGLFTMLGHAQYTPRMSHPTRLKQGEGCMHLAQPAFICPRFQATSQTMLQAQSLCIIVTNLELFSSWYLALNASNAQLGSFSKPLPLQVAMPQIHMSLHQQHAPCAQQENSRTRQAN
jgi:hypothetical protein